MENKYQCVLCLRGYTGRGNNPYPLRRKRRCCDDCNTNKVMPARINKLLSSQQQNMMVNLLK